MRTRTAAKARLTRSIKKLNELLSSEAVDFLRITEEKLECENRLKIFDDCQKAAESFITDEDELIHSIESSEDFRESKKRDAN